MVPQEHGLAVVEIEGVFHRAAVVAARSRKQLGVEPRIVHAQPAVVEQDEVAVGQHRGPVLTAELPLGIADDVQRRRPLAEPVPLFVAQVGERQPPNDLVAGRQVGIDSQHCAAAPEGRHNVPVDHLHRIDVCVVVLLGRETGLAVLERDGVIGVPVEQRRTVGCADLDGRVQHPL